MVTVLHTTGLLDDLRPVVPCGLLDVPVAMGCGALAAMQSQAFPVTPVGCIGTRMIFLVRSDLDESVGMGVGSAGHEVIYWRSPSAFMEGREASDDVTWLIPPGNEGADLPHAVTVLLALQVVAAQIRSKRGQGGDSQWTA